MADISAFGASLAAAGLADIALFEGRTDDAARILEDGAAVDLGNDNGAAAGRKLTALALAQLALGQPAEAVATARRAVEASQQEPVLFEAARVSIGVGDEEGAADLAVQLSERLAPEPRAYAKLIEGELALADGDATRAVTLFLEAQTILDTWIGRLDLGLAYLQSDAFP